MTDKPLVQGSYIGPIEEWKGATALIMRGSSVDKVLVQFDKYTLLHGVNLHLGWHSFDAKDWKVIENDDSLL